MPNLSYTKLVLRPGKVTGGMVFLKRAGNTTDRQEVAGQVANMLSKVIGGEPSYIGEAQNFTHYFYCKYARPLVVRVVPQGSNEWGSSVKLQYNQLPGAAKQSIGDDPIVANFLISWRSGDVSYPLPAYNNAVVVTNVDSLGTPNTPDMFEDQFRDYFAKMVGADSALKDAWIAFGLKMVGSVTIAGPVILASEIGSWILTKSGGAAAIATGAGELGGSAVRQAGQAYSQLATGIAKGAGAAGAGFAKGLTGIDPQAQIIDPLKANWKSIALIAGIGVAVVALIFKDDIASAIAGTKKVRKDVQRAVLKQYTGI